MGKLLLSSLYFLVTPLVIKLTYSQRLIANERMNIEYSRYTIDTPYFPPILASIANESKHIYCYEVNSSLLQEWPALQLKFYAESKHPENKTCKTDCHYPLVSTVYWHGSVRLWEIPVNYPNEPKELEQMNPHSENMFGKTLWLYPESKRGDSWDLTVEISTYNNEEMINYQIQIVVLENFVVKANTLVGALATHSTPSYFMFNTSALDWQFVFIEATSYSNICARVGVAKLNGPFLNQIGDLMDNSNGIEIGETFTLKAGLTIWKERFPDGCIVVFIPFLNDTKCEKSTNQNNTVKDDPFRKKDVRFTIVEGMPYSTYVLPVFLPLLMIIAIGIVAFISLHYSSKLQCELLKSKQFVPISRRDGLFISNIMIEKLITEEPSRVANQSQRYWQLAFVSSEFYIIPVLILIAYFRERLLETGNLDLCCFNHFCSHIWGNFHDFNHMYSNIGYVTFGPLFAVLVRCRQSFHQIADVVQEDFGVFTHYSLLYCMAFIITMTGVMSAGYHVCPNQSNFTFDTVFMYTIAAIAIVTVHQLRHPIYLSASFTFAALALVACSTVLGLVWEKLFVRVVFTAIHVIFLVSVLSKLCFHGYVRPQALGIGSLGDGGLVHNWYDTMHIILIKLTDDFKKGKLLKLQHDVWTSPHDPEIQIVPGPGRLVVPGFLFVVNSFSLVAIWTIWESYNFATQVLFICVMNGSLYLIFYCAVKWYHGECRRLLWLQPGLYLASSFTIWVIGIWFFSHETSSWEISAAESRVKNEECILLGFYDYHDMWHFLSSIGLFATAMLLLTVDDDLVDQPKSTIPVF